MRIVLTNDDGVHAPGLWAAAEALRELGEVVVIAPDRDMSGMGTAMTLMNVVRVQDIPSPVQGVRAYSVQGTPADCVILGAEKLLDRPPDLVVSGINHGANLGLDVMVSGTVGGAFQGYFRHIPSMAVSVVYETEVRYEAAARATKALARAISANSMPSPLLLNVNVPSLTPEEIERVEVTRLGPAAYLENVEQVTDGRRTHYWIRHNRKVNAEVEEGTDVWAVRNRRVSITPLHVSFSLETPLGVFDALADTVAEAFG
ncbi:MAG: 5'/3'-nucleotidase SurE [Chloroflexi bacterium]|nr:5'/3'-nucleotidase SurE [Chloroflexota bacterium]